MAEHVVVLNWIQKKTTQNHWSADSQKTEDRTKSTDKTDIAGQTEQFSYRNTNFPQMFQSKRFTQSPAVLFIPSYIELCILISDAWSQVFRDTLLS